MSIELGISYHTLHKKVINPGEFTVNEMVRIAELFGVKYDIIFSFVREQMNVRSKSRVFRK
jgi:hypothetical protein